MARRLIDDCFLHDKDRLKHREALDILRDRLRPVVEAESIALTDAMGRVLAKPITAPHPVPRFDNTAVDGYAFAHADYVSLDGKLPISGRIAAGGPMPPDLAPKTAVRIFTGAVMPNGADTIAMQEDCEIGEDDTVTIPSGLKLGANRRRAGEDVKQGEQILAPGLRLHPQDMAAIATTGLGQIDAFAPVRIALASTGDEIIPPGQPQAPGQVYDSNKVMLRALLDRLPVEITDLGILADDEAQVTNRLSQAAQEFDLVITTGGASRGEEDHMITAIDTLGTRQLWQLAIKPGRPMSFGQVGDCVFLNLPGNPVAVFVCFLLYVRPAIVTLGGGPWEKPIGFELPAAFEIARKKPDRREFLRGILVRDGANAVAVEKFARDGSGLISGLRAADGLIEIPEEVVSVAKGDAVRFIPFSSFGLF